MTRWGFRSLAAVLVAAWLSGGVLMLYAFVWPQQSERCDAWLAHPREGHFRLRGCPIDIEHARAAEHDAERRPTRAFVEVESDGPRLFAVTRDHRVLAWVERLETEEDRDARTRTIERHAAELRFAQTVEGEVVRADAPVAVTDYSHRFAVGRDYVMTPARESRTRTRIMGLGTAMFVVFAPLALVLFFAQLRWRRRTDDLTGRPRVF